ncbi:MAG: lipoprotein-releasing ABC transporter permease subunit [Pseudomonadota bacterium]
MSAKSSPFGAVERSLAWRYLRAKREHGGASLTAIISFIGIALAVWALIAIMSIMAGFRATLLDALLGGQPHVYAAVSDLPAGQVDEIVTSIRAVDGIASAHPFIEEQVLAIHEGVSSGGALVKAISQEELAVLPFLEDGGAAAIEAGFGEGRFGGDVILLGAFLASDLRVGEGDRIRLISQETTASPFGTTPRSKTYTVGGLFKTGSVELDKAYIFMPLEQGQVFFKKRDQYEFIDIRLDDPEETAAAMASIRERIDGFLYMFDWQSQRGAYLGALNLERSMMRLVMLVLITITALNIITGVVMLVKNKTRDIAILRTIGASRASMMRVFVMIGGFLGIAGALTGTVLGILTVTYISDIEAFLGWVRGAPLFPPDVYGLEGLPARLDWTEVIFTFTWATAMSVLVTLWPAWRAAQLDPVEALRFE